LKNIGEGKEKEVVNLAWGLPQHSQHAGFEGKDSRTWGGRRVTGIKLSLSRVGRILTDPRVSNKQKNRLTNGDYVEGGEEEPASSPLDENGPIKRKKWVARPIYKTERRPGPNCDPPNLNATAGTWKALTPGRNLGGPRWTKNHLRVAVGMF